jgi:hypothetical protein
MCVAANVRSDEGHENKILPLFIEAETPRVFHSQSRSGSVCTFSIGEFRYIEMYTSEILPDEVSESGNTN